MPKPQPSPIDPSEVRDKALEVIKVGRFPVLATVNSDGQPRLRPVSPVKVDDFTIYVANLRFYGKTAEIAANNKVELCYMDSEHNQVRITARAEVVADVTLLEEIWESNNLLKMYLGTPDNPDLIVYRMIPNQVRYMQEWALEYHEVELG